MKKNLLLFGGSSDVGEAIIKELSNDYNIYATRNTGKIFSKVKQTFLCNLRKLKDIKEVVKNVPSLDAVVFSTYPEILNDAKDFNGYLKTETLLRGYMYAMTEVINEKLKKGGKIINILGQSANNGLPDAPFMGMGLAAIHNYSKSVNATYGRKGDFAIYDILMGPMNTKMWDRIPGKITKDWRDNSKEFVNPNIPAKYVKQILENSIGPTEIIIDGFYSLPRQA